MEERHASCDRGDVVSDELGEPVVVDTLVAMRSLRLCRRLSPAPETAESWIDLADAGQASGSTIDQ